MASILDSLSTNRITGMYSGIDTDALIKASLAAKQTKIDKLLQSKVRDEWKRDMYLGINNQLRIFREDFGSALGSKSLMAKSTVFDYSITNETNTQALRVSANASAKEGNYKVNVKQLATNAAMNGAKLTASSYGISTTTLEKTKIEDIASFANGRYDGLGDGSFSFTINGEEFNFSVEDTLKTVIDTVNKSSAGVTMEYSQITDAFTIKSSETGEYKEIFSMLPEPERPAEFWGVMPDRDDYTDDAAYQNDLDAYNIAFKAYNDEVMAPYYQSLTEYNDQQATVNSNKGKNIEFTDGDGFLAHIGLTSVTRGQDAIVSVNGGEELVYSDNTFTLDGITFTVTETTEEGKTADFTISRNIQTSVDKVKAFVESFNELIESLYTPLNAKKKYGYDPLTDEQKAELSESEIALWEEQAKSGLLYRDNNLSLLYSKLREAMTANLGGEGSLSSIGITVGKYEVGKSFKIELDEEKLRTALSEDPDKVYNMLSTIDKGNESQTGLMDRINTALDTFVSNTRATNVQNLNNSISKYERSISEQESNIALEAEKLYVKYAKLESALASMDAQSSQMASLFGTSS